MDFFAKYALKISAIISLHLLFHPFTALQPEEGKSSSENEITEPGPPHSRLVQPKSVDDEKHQRNFDNPGRHQRYDHRRNVITGSVEDAFGHDPD